MAKAYPERAPVEDIGLDETIKKLTPEKIEETIKHVLKNETAARLKTYVQTCVHCGLCSNACHFYNSHDGDPKYAPVSKVKDTMWEILKKDGKVSPEFIRRRPASPSPSATSAAGAACTAPLVSTWRT